MGNEFVLGYTMWPSLAPSSTNDHRDVIVDSCHEEGVFLHPCNLQVAHYAQIGSLMAKI